MTLLKYALLLFKVGSRRLSRAGSSALLARLGVANGASDSGDLFEEVTNFFAQLLVLALLMVQLSLRCLMLRCLELQLSLSQLTDLIPTSDGALPSILLGLSLNSSKPLLTSGKLFISKVSALLRGQIILLHLENLLFQLNDFALLLFVCARHLLNIFERGHGHGAGDTGRRQALGLLRIEELVELGLLVSDPLLFGRFAAAGAWRQASLFLLEFRRFCLRLHVALLLNHGINDVVTGAWG